MAWRIVRLERQDPAARSAGIPGGAPCLHDALNKKAAWLASGRRDRESGVWLLSRSSEDWLLPNAPRDGAVPTKVGVGCRVGWPRCGVRKFLCLPVFRGTAACRGGLGAGRAAWLVKHRASGSDRMLNGNRSHYKENFSRRMYFFWIAVA
ncbi:hypothetical protein CO2235_MP20090 [Cupriavidus oxalaticus]|uniref:Uncharacterized protein n=1 Tax=Cupriavidus oxalaticus TaxID=96344 RepID=A0A375GGN8_9BURK|nr:hypothetical protein CO2235_MP20090 [Cupriavidus oxalaticus]